MKENTSCHDIALSSKWSLRYIPRIPVILNCGLIACQDHHNNRLDQSSFPFIRDAPPELTNTLRPGAPPPPQASGSLRSARPTWHKAPSARMGNTEGKQRMIIFVAGGMTYSEIRLAYTVGQALGKEVLIGGQSRPARCWRMMLTGETGSTHVLTPEEFVKDLKGLGRGGIGGYPPKPIPLHPLAPGRATRHPGQPTSYQK